MNAKTLLRAAVLGPLTLAVGGTLAPALAQSQTQPAGTLLDAAPGSLTLSGITLYGTFDAAYVYQNHGAPVSTIYGSGIENLAVSAKNAVKSISDFAPSGLEQSKLGIKGDVPLGAGFSAVFKLETGFSPLSGRLADGPGSVARDSGVSQLNQVSFGDSSRAGQFLNGPAYGGISHTTFGTLTFGRQQSLMFDAMVQNDPQGTSNAFSVLGYVGAPGGGGSTENLRLDDTLKYVLPLGPFRAAGTYAPGGDGTGLFGRELSASLNATFGALSIDAVYMNNTGALSISPLSVSFCTTNICTNSVGATISDNEAWSIQGKYTLDALAALPGKLTLYGGYEHIAFNNPDTPIAPGTHSQGGYTLATTNNANYDTTRILEVAWAGAKYAFAPNWTATAAYYRYQQSSFLTGAAPTSCAAATATNAANASRGSFIGKPVASNCAGALDDASLMVDWQATQRLDLYAGINYSIAGGGIASGYPNSSITELMTGARFHF